MVGVKTWTDDGIWFVLLASKIPSPCSAQKSKPGRFFTDEAIGLLCKKNVKDLRHTPNAASVRYARTQKPEAQPSPEVLETIERLRSSVSQAQDSTNGITLENPRGGTTMAAERRSSPGSFSNTSSNTMSPMPMGSPLTQSQPRRTGNWNRSEAGQFNPNRSHTMSRSANEPFAKSYGRGHENTVPLATTNQRQQHQGGSLGNGSRQQQPIQVHSATTRSNPLWYPAVEVSSLMRQTMGNSQGTNAYMHNGGDIPEYSQHAPSGTMYQFYGNQMGPNTHQIQSYGQVTPMDSPYAKNYGEYTQALPGLGMNGMPMPTGPTDVGSSSYPYDTPSYGQFEAYMVPQIRQSYGETVSQNGLPYTNQYPPQQQYGIEYRFPPLNIDLDGKEVMPQRHHGLPQATTNDPDFANISSLGLAQSVFSSPSDTSDSSNGFIQPLDNQYKSDDIETQGDLAHQVRIMSQEPQPSVSAEKGKKRSVDEAEISDITFDGSCEGYKKKQNSEDKDCSRRREANEQNARHDRELSEQQQDNTQELFTATSSGSPIDFSDIALDTTSSAIVVSGVSSATHSSDEAGLSPISTNTTVDAEDPTSTKFSYSPYEMPNLKSQGIFHESVETFLHQEEGTATRKSNDTEDDFLSEEDFPGLSDHFDDIYYDLSTSFHEMSDEVIQADHFYLIDQM
ncbi:uncharacterized protein EAE97_001225 [Botrytis byssoidea]|uniref:Uncharacterized protein n=1 Tax=Botrytis byssoidea TaxID=139641 RepID=A0A9P5LYY6_9HELO|nr:uncharacterized protein EAE97_001225 [Botrytis byssoidea]KAF7953826.1 hypothetical protein EAE97_001225 [Botrytis byssoidea]